MCYNITQGKTDEGYRMIVAELVRISLFDLHNPLANEKMPEKNYKKRQAIKEAKIRRREAKWFFTKSRLFKLTGLNFAKLDRMYLSERMKKNGRGKSTRIKKSCSL